MDRIRNFIAHVNGQFWLLPGILCLAAAGLAYGMIVHGQTLLLAEPGELSWLYGGDAQTALNLLSSLLSGMMTMTSLLISVTFVILTLAANQLGPRLISIFVADRQIQSVIGLFMGTILYLILVLRSVDQDLGADGLPHLAVTVASGLTVLCLFALLLYIHKVANAIVADNIVREVAGELEANIATILEGVEEADEPHHPGRPDGPSTPIGLGRQGYVQVIDYNHLRTMATEHEVIVMVNVRPGHYIQTRGHHVEVFGRRLTDDGELASALRSAFTIGKQRTPAQDLEFGIRQLVEIGTRALSPGTNDPFTAEVVVDRLSSSLDAIFSRHFRPTILRDEDGEVRVIADRSDAMGVVDAAFNPIRQAAVDHPAILIRIADAIGRLAPNARTPQTLAALRSQLDKISQTASIGNIAPCDREDIAMRIASARGELARWRDR
ncbi:DUF2254 domain-containing protein [Pelagibacterium montanilacus]|uniref:DUF2254 domain-containing protein n=1 Tax=Pelagibacterium montanilacus TaxID=2185280 RepID=UPI000F8E4907|nr:DUF2254 domain-containing protein [Pelagibacterium montanilacus]